MLSIKPTLGAISSLENPEFENFMLQSVKGRVKIYIIIIILRVPLSSRVVSLQGAQTVKRVHHATESGDLAI